MHDLSDGAIEVIAQRWFESLPSNNSGKQAVWDKQPENIKDVFRDKAREFVANPSRWEEKVKAARILLESHLQGVEHVAQRMREVAKS